MAPPSSYPTDSLLAFEIAQQPDVWPTTLARVAKGSLARRVQPSPVILCGAGTSAYAASAIAEAWPGACAIPTTDLLVSSAIEIENSSPGLRKGGLVISLARSGDSPESVAVVEKMRRAFPQVKHLAIVCNSEGRLAQLDGIEVLLLDPRTNDRSLAMTGSFSNLTLSGLALRHLDDLQANITTVCDRVRSALPQHNEVLEAIARACGDRIVILSSSMQALGREAALKIVELTGGRVMAMPETFLGFRHGAVGFLREDTPILCFLSSDRRKRVYELDLIEDLRGKGLGRLVLVGDEPSVATPQDWFVPAMAPELADFLRTPFEITVAQLLAYHLAVHAGVDPDNPSPKGTITRVVRPFRIHPEVDATA